MLRPTIIFTVIISTIGGLQLFTEPYLFQPRPRGATGGSARQYQTVVMYLYEKSFGQHAVQVRLRGRDRLVPRSADRGHLARELPRHPPDQVGRVMVESHDRIPLARPRSAPPARATLQATPGPVTYLFLILVAAASVFPLYWSFVVASHDNSAIGAYPPVLTPGGHLWHNIAPALQLGRGQRRLLGGTDELGHRRPDRHASPSCSSARSPASPSRSSSSADARCCCWSSSRRCSCPSSSA